MDQLAQIFEANRVILYSTYGQVFFVMGLAVMLQSRRYSRLALARSIWLLGAFGIVHGMSEWAYVFVPVQAEYLPHHLVDLLWIGHALVEAISFAFLFQFGAELVWPALGKRWIRFVPAAIFALWGFLFLYVGTYYQIWVGGHADESLFGAGDTLARYLLALPGALVVAAGLLLQVKEVQAMELPRIARYLRWAAGSFVAYAFLAGLLVPPAAFFPASVLNYDWLWTSLGVPVPVFRSLCGLAIAYFVARALKVFDVEMDRMIEQMERQQMIAVERERIGRDLHDGTIQSIYAAGLALEDVVFTMGKDVELARRKTRQVMESLNQTIGEIRDYILDLRSAMENRDFEEQLRTLAGDFAGRAGLKAEVRILPQWRRPFTRDQTSHLLQVARESFANIAQHAGASRVQVALTYAHEAVTLEIRDDGRGFDLDLVAQRYARERGHGLHNISHRIDLLGGRLRIHTSPGGGTRIMAEVPLAREAT